MSIVTRTAAQSAAQLIRDETVSNQNTATRVGGTIENLTDSTLLMVGFEFLSLSGDEDGYTINVNTSTAFIDSDTDRTIAGLANGSNGRTIRLVNNGSYTIYLLHEGAAEAGEGILTPNGLRYGLPPGSSVWVQYATLNNAWSVLATDPQPSGLRARYATSQTISAYSMNADQTMEIETSPSGFTPDGTAVILWDTVLVIPESTVAGVDCGLYVVIKIEEVDGGNLVHTLRRHPQMCSTQTLNAVTDVRILSGSVYAGTTWRNITPFGAVLGAASINFINNELSTTFSTLTQDENNWGPAGWQETKFARVQSNALRTITGLDAPDTGPRRKTLVNFGSNNIVLSHDDGSSSAENRILIIGGVDYILYPNCAVDVWYDRTSSRWRLAGLDASGVATPLSLVLFVDEAATGIQDGSVDHPYQTVQAAINAATTGSTILIVNATSASNVTIAKNIVLGAWRFTGEAPWGGYGRLGENVSIGNVSVSGNRLVTLAGLSCGTIICTGGTATITANHGTSVGGAITGDPEVRGTGADFEGAIACISSRFKDCRFTNSGTILTIAGVAAYLEFQNCEFSSGTIEIEFLEENGTAAMDGVSYESWLDSDETLTNGAILLKGADPLDAVLALSNTTSGNNLEISSEDRLVLAAGTPSTAGPDNGLIEFKREGGGNSSFIGIRATGRLRVEGEGGVDIVGVASSSHVSINSGSSAQLSLAGGTSGTRITANLGTVFVDRLRALQYAELSDQGNSGTAKTITWSLLGNLPSALQKVTLNNNVTFTFTNPDMAAFPLFLELHQDGVGGRTVTFPTSVANRTALSAALTTTLSTFSLIQFYFNGTFYVGTLLGTGMTVP